MDDASERKSIPEDRLRSAPVSNIALASGPPPAPGGAPPPKDATPPGARSASSNAPPPGGASGLRIAAILFRTAFIFILMALVFRVAQPQSETIWSAYETPGDLVRLWLGIGVCIWLGWQLFDGGPKDVHGYRTWVYLGLTVVPFSLICLVALW